MTKPTTDEWLNLKIQAEKDSHDEVSQDGQYDEEYIAEVYEDYQQLLHIRAQRLAAQEMAKALEAGIQAGNLHPEGTAGKSLAAFRRAGGL